MYECMYECMYVCMYDEDHSAFKTLSYVCMYACMYVLIDIPICRDKITTPTIFLHASDENWGNNIY